MADIPEGGLRQGRVEFVRETTTATTPSDPNFEKYSDIVTSFSYSPDSNVGERFGINVDRPYNIAEYTPGGQNAEEHTATVEYFLDQDKWLVSGFIIDPDSSTALGVQSTDSGDTSLDVTIEGKDGGSSVSETITTDGTDATTFVTGTQTFEEIDEITLASSATGDIQVYVDDSGSPGAFLAQLPSGTTNLEDSEHVPENAAGDGLIRDADGAIPNTHTIVYREDRQQGGSDNAGFRLYFVLKGAKIDNTTLTGEPEDEAPVNISLDYQAVKGRAYKINQPSSSTLIAFKSTDASDTSQSITIEDEGSGTSESVSLNGTTLVSTTNNYDNIDAIELDSETTGDVEVYVNSGSQGTPSEGTQLMTLRGSGSYADSAGDLGVPALGSGSHASTTSDPANMSFEEFIGDQIDRPDGSALAPIVSSAEVSVSNNLDTIAKSDAPEFQIDPGQQDIEISSTLVGPDESFNLIDEHLRITQDTFVWGMTSGTMYANDAVISDYGDREATPDQTRIENDVTLMARTLDIGISS